MEENKNNPENPTPQPNPYPYYIPRPRRAYPVGHREVGLALATLISAMLAVNGMLAGGLNLAFALGALGVTVSAAVYLRRCGHRAAPYSTAILALVCVIVAAFPRSGDNVLKALTFLALPVVSSLGLTLASGKNRFSAADASSVLDGFDTLLGLGVGCMGPSARGLKGALGSAGRAGRTAGSIALGVLLAVPLLAVVLPLLVSADAAFAGLLDKLPDFKFGEAVRTVLLGGLFACVFYTRATALQNREKPEKSSARARASPPSR